MEIDQLKTVLAGALPAVLADDLVDDYILIRQDVATGTLGRSAPGKFVETVVQCLQYLDSNAYDAKPSVDAYLRNCESKATSLDEGLRVCAARIARSMYTLRNKRNLMHKGAVDPNSFDLRYLLSGSQWIIAELLRHCSGISMEEAGQLIRVLQEPVHEIVEDFGDRRVVLADLSVPNEILALLHSRYPEAMPLKDLQSSIDRRNPRSVSNACRKLWSDKLLEGNSKDGYQLTRKGHREANKVIAELGG